MTIGLHDSALYGPLFAERVVAESFSDAGRLRAMLAVEAALARVQGRLGIIPREAAEAIDRVAGELNPDPAALAEGTEQAGVPVVALVAALRDAVGGSAAAHVHWGATTQDIMDTALVVQLRQVLDHLDSRLEALNERLAGLTETHRGTLMAARTHSQQALPTTFGLKTAGWLLPLVRHRQRLAELRPRLLAVQFGGAAGTLAALGERGIEVMEALARELDLAAPALSWHTQRDTLAELAGWLSLLSGSLGKLGQDVILLAQTEVGELRESGAGGRGGSSTMPQKSNPILSELLITAARLNASLLSAMHQALIAEHERATHGWQLEWLSLPQMLVNTGAALYHARFIADNLVVEAGRMRANLEASNGLLLAEAATFALAEHMPRPEAQQRVKQACREVVAGGRHLMDVLAEHTDASIDWQALKDPARYLGATDILIDRALAEARIQEND